MRELLKFLNPLRKRIALMISRAVVSLVKDSFAMQGLQVQALAGEVLDDIERFQNYGFTSVPLAGAEAIILSLGGHRDHAVAIAVDDRRYRKKNLAPGEVALYTDEGDYILFKRGRHIEIVSGAKVKITAPEIEATASTKASVTSPLVDVIASTKVTFTTPLVECTQALNVAGIATVGALASTGLAGASSVTGNLNITSGNVTADGIGLKTHVHSDPQGGTTGGPSG